VWPDGDEGPLFPVAVVIRRSEPGSEHNRDITPVDQHATRYERHWSVVGRRGVVLQRPHAKLTASRCDLLLGSVLLRCSEGRTSPADREYLRVPKIPVNR
jgi:hypothetical protein